MRGRVETVAESIEMQKIKPLYRVSGGEGWTLAWILQTESGSPTGGTLDYGASSQRRSSISPNSNGVALTSSCKGCQQR